MIDRRPFLGAFLMMLGMTASGSALQFTFDAAPVPPAGTSLRIPQYVEQGFLFKPSGPVATSPPYRLSRTGSGIASMPANGTAYLQLQAGDSLHVSGTNGELFTPVSVDLAEYPGATVGPKSIGFSGIKADGSSVTAQFTTDGVNDGSGPVADFQTFSFPSSFTSLVRLEATSDEFSLDNLAVTNVVAPPPTPTVYNIDFNEPEHALNQTVRTGSGPKLVSRVLNGTPTVRSTSSALTNRPLEFDAVGGYEQIALTLPSSEASPVGYLIEFDVATSALVDSSYAFSVVLDTPEIRTLSLHGGSRSVEVFQPFGTVLPYPAGFADGIKYHFAIVLDFQGVPSWSVYVDSVRIYRSALNAQTLQTIRFVLGSWRSAYDAPATKAALDNMTVTSGDFSSYAPPAKALASWRTLHGLATNGSSDHANPSGDGVPNLLKFAFNLAPGAGDLADRANPRILATNGLRGLPRIQSGTNSWRVEYLRRKSGLTYRAETSTLARPTQWTPVTGSRTTTSIDDTWERVSEVIPRPTNAPGGFLRFRVSSSP